MPLHPRIAHRANRSLSAYGAGMLVCAGMLVFAVVSGWNVIAQYMEVTP